MENRKTVIGNTQVSVNKIVEIYLEFTRQGKELGVILSIEQAEQLVFEVGRTLESLGVYDEPGNK